MSASSVDRGVALSDEAAVHWLTSRGFDIRDDRRSLQLFGDEIRQSGFVLRRIWLSRVNASVLPGLAPDGFHASYVIEGSAKIDRDREESISGGHVVFRDQSTPLELVSNHPIALIQVISERPRLLGVDRLDNGVITLGESMAVIFTTLVTAILNSSVAPTDNGFSQIRRAIESVLSAGLIDTSGPTEWRSDSSAQRRLFLRATALIEQRADDPAVNLDDIASELAVSKTYLQRAFRAAGTTPLRYLQRLRATNARALIAAHPATGRAHLERIARQSGFNSVETMRAVIARELGRDREGP